LWWVITTFHRRRRQYRTLFDRPAFPHLEAIELRTPAEAERLLRRVETSPHGIG
jgi:hypothetical protein